MTDFERRRIEDQIREVIELLYLFPNRYDLDELVKLLKQIGIDL